MGFDPGALKGRDRLSFATPLPSFIGLARKGAIREVPPLNDPPPGVSPG